MITATKQGRNLLIAVEGIEEPFVIRPLPGYAGIQMTNDYLATMGGNGQNLVGALQMAVDGARENTITGLWEPVPEEQQTNYSRIGRELSQTEAEWVLMPAFFWQTVLGMDGVKTYVEGMTDNDGNGLGGTLKAAAALTSRLGLSARLTSHGASTTA